MLAQVLASTKHNVVVTTNYDNLVTDAPARAEYRHESTQHPRQLRATACGRPEYDAAEALHERALEADPNHASCARDYANFLANVWQDSEPDVFDKRPTVIDPTDVNEFGF